MALLKFGHLKIEMTIRSPSRDPEQAAKIYKPSSRERTELVI